MDSTENEKTSEEWDFFICHASEDKKEVVRPLAEALTRAGFSVWYDEFTLTLGDNLRRAIDRGLGQSKYGIVILSENFFKKEWPQVELDGLTTRELDGKKVILPVWHKVDREYVLKFSPPLANRFAVKTDKGIEEVVAEVVRAVKPAQEHRMTPKETQSVVGRLDYVIDFLRSKDVESIDKLVKEMGFEDLISMFSDVLDAIAFFDLRESQTNSSVFDFIHSAIVERNKAEGAKVFEQLLKWYFQTVTPYFSKETMLELFSRLTRLSHLKEVVAKTNHASDFVAEFGISYSYDNAGVNAEILKNIQFSLSDVDYQRIIELALANDQILGSWRAKELLVKILTSSDGKVDRAKLNTLRRKLQ